MLLVVTGEDDARGEGPRNGVSPAPPTDRWAPPVPAQLESLRQMAADVRIVSSVQAAVELLTAADAAAAPELILLVTARPGEHGRRSMQALQRAAPLARVWRILGTWCEGEARSGRPPAGCLFAYDHQVLPRLRRDLARRTAGKNPSWTQPVTATPDELLLATLDELTERPAAGAIAVHASTAAAMSALADLCRAAGRSPHEWPNLHHPLPSEPACSAVLWDTTARALHDTQQVGRLQRAAGETPVVALVGFPRPDDLAAAEQAGIAAVVSKPFLAADLLDEVARVGR